MTMSENEWQQVTSNDNECWEITSDSEWYNEWQQITTRGTLSDNEWEQVKGVILSFKMKQNANLVPEGFYSTFYVMYEYYFYHTSISSCFSPSVLLKLLKHQNITCF